MPDSQRSSAEEFLNRPASDLMTAKVVSIAENAPLKEAMALLIDRGFSGAPVANAAGRPVGVISQGDILIHERNTQSRVDATVSAVMTPVVFSVRPDVTARTVIEEMLRLRVHRLFVVDPSGVLVGVIAMSDVLLRILE